MSLNQATPPDPDNILDLAQNICKEGEAPPTELEQKRKVAFRAFEITLKQLQVCATEISNHAILDEQPLKQRFERMRLAESIFVVCGFIEGALLPQPEGTVKAE